jgi:hypothetical protein
MRSSQHDVVSRTIGKMNRRCAVIRNSKEIPSHIG